MLQMEIVNQLTEMMSEQKVDAVIVGPSSDLQYLTGLAPYADERFKALVVLADKRCFYICPSLYYEETVNTLGEDSKIYVWDDTSGFLSALDKAKTEYGLVGKRIAVNEGIRAIDMLDLQDFLGGSFVKADKMLEQLRIIKSNSERQNLRRAAEIIDEVVMDLTKYIRPGLREKDVKRKVEELCIEKGASGISFEPLIASGPNSSMPHYNDDKRVIEEKDIVIIDIGCKYNGYCSDITRTVFVGEPTDEQRKIYEIVLEANRQGERCIREGLAAEDVDKAVRDVIEKAGYGKYFIHRTGHGIGVAVHEAPYINTGNRLALKSGMAFSIEPGIYLPGKFGVRIEDIVVVDGDKAEVLNKCPKELIAI